MKLWIDQDSLWTKPVTFSASSPLLINLTTLFRDFKCCASSSIAFQDLCDVKNMSFAASVA